MLVPSLQRLPFCLFIDPSQTMRSFFDLAFRRANYPPCAVYGDPIAALRAIGEQTIAVPDIAYVCWKLPRMDGVEVFRLMQQRRYHTARVMLLDKDQDGVLVHLKSRIAGAHSTLVKPFTTQQLFTHLATLKCTY